MLQKRIADASLIIAYLDPDERENHAWATEVFSRQGGLHTCEAVLAEVCARLAYMRQPQSKVLRMVEDGGLRLDFNVGANAPRIVRLMEKYADLPMDFADACLVVMTQDHPRSLIYTLDAADFSVYRRNGREIVPFESPR